MVDGNEKEKSPMLNFEKFETWNEAIAFADRVSDLFPLGLAP